MKKVWVAPVLETFGTVVELTQQTYLPKEAGLSDGYILNCVTLKDAESCATCP
jgi:hypothetical protein